MAKISSFKIAAGIFGVAALMKISVFAIAVAMLELAGPAQSGSLGRIAIGTFGPGTVNNSISGQFR